jgi:hypothetical protein
MCDPAKAALSDLYMMATLNTVRGGDLEQSGARASACSRQDPRGTDNITRDSREMFAGVIGSHLKQLETLGD